MVVVQALADEILRIVKQHTDLWRRRAFKEQTSGWKAYEKFIHKCDFAGLS